MNHPSLTACLFAAASFLGMAHAGEVIQIDASDVFNMRPISTVVASKLIPMTSDIDGAGGVATETAAKAMGMEDPYSLPDDGRFPANDKHPEILMAYGRDDGKMNLARKSIDDDAFVLTVPPKNYAKLWLFLASGRGISTIKVEMKYGDKSVETRSMVVPDWFWELKADDLDRCYVASNLSKWGPAKQLEKDHHYIFGLNIRPNPAKTLEKIRVSKEKPGIMAFFGATGQVGE